MRQFASIALAAFCGVLGAMLVYYFVVTKPGIENEFARVQRARTDARSVGIEIEKAAADSVARARAGLDAQAQDLRRREMASAALSAGQGHKVAVSEFYANSGKLPAAATEAGLSSNPRTYANDGALGVSIEPAGVIRIDLGDLLARGGTIRLIPTADPATYLLRWRCEAIAFPDMARYHPQCTTAREPAASAVVVEGAPPPSSPPG